MKFYGITQPRWYSGLASRQCCHLPQSPYVIHNDYTFNVKDCKGGYTMIYMFGLFLRFCYNKLQLPADLLDLLADAGPPRLQNTHARPTTTGTPVRSNFNEEVVVQPGPCQAQWKKWIKLTTVSSCKESTNLNKNNTVGGCGRRSSGMGLKNGHCFSSVKNGKQGICHIIIQAFLTACRFAGLHYIRGKTPWIKIKGP